MTNEGAILDAIDKWNSSDGDESLYEFLGWTWEEYSNWISHKG